MHQPDTIERLPIANLLPYARNSRTHSPEQVAAVAKSIQEFGFTNPVLIRQDGTIIAGHGRVMAARQLGLLDVPCIRLSHLTDEQARAYVIADNKLAELAGWDKGLLALEMRELQDFGFDMALTGFSDAELSQLLDLKESKLPLVKEYSADDFNQFDHQCPKCRFEFNAKT